MTPMHATRVLLVEDHALFAEALETALRLEGYEAQRIPPSGELTTDDLTQAVLSMQPAVVLLDLDLGSFGTGLPLINPLARAGIAVILVTASADRSSWGAAVHEGARKVLPKNTPMNEVVATIRRAVDGLPLMADDERRALVREWRVQVAEEQDVRTRLGRLTRREAEVLGLLMTGRQVGDIAKLCFVSESTVRTQVKSILAKLQVGSQIGAVALAHRVRWEPPVIYQDW
ncbi:MAG TPA: response regulator transcription factor [Marmoricola sp.]